MELNDLQRLAVADAMGKAIKDITNPRGGAHGAPTLRTEADDALREDFERDGTDRRRISINGVDVGTLSARVSKPTRGSRMVVDDERVLAEWLRSDDGFDLLRSVVRMLDVQKEIMDEALVDGVLPDGCRMVEYEEPAKWQGTTLRVKAQAVAQALGEQLPSAVVGLLGGGSE